MSVLQSVLLTRTRQVLWLKVVGQQQQRVEEEEVVVPGVRVRREGMKEEREEAVWVVPRWRMVE